MNCNCPDDVSSMSSVVSALATVSIPLVLAWWGHRQHKENIKQSLEARTLRELDELNHRVSASVTVIMQLCSNCKDLVYETISENKELEGHVFAVLNQYEYLCFGANEGLFENNIILSLRGKALKKTQEQYEKYNTTYRDKHDSEAWVQVDRFINAHMNRLQELQS